MRVEKLRQAMQDSALDAVLVTRPENQRYLSGFTGGEAALLITRQKALLLTDFRYYDQVAEEAPDFELVKVEDTASEVLKRCLKELEIRALGFESTHVPYAQHQEWRQRTRGTRWIPTKDLVENLRLVKDEQELQKMTKAIEIADRACDHMREFIQPGMSEKEVAWELEAHMRTHGAEGVAFSLIVASGPNGAKPHAVPGDRKIQHGEPIVIDMGATFEGYHSDLTRTMCVGEPDERLQEIYGIVLHAQLAAEQGAKPGMTGKELDALARRIVVEAGYGEQFGHGLGHGVGLAIHEGPGVSWRSDDALREGMVCTIEPGIYITGWGGVRIEDMVWFQDGAARVLSKARKELRAR